MPGLGERCRGLGNSRAEGVWYLELTAPGDSPEWDEADGKTSMETARAAELFRMAHEIPRCKATEKPGRFWGCLSRISTCSGVSHRLDTSVDMSPPCTSLHLDCGEQAENKRIKRVCSARLAGLLPNRHPGAVLAIAGSETSALGRRIPSHRARCVIPTLLAAPTASLDLGPPNGAGTRQIWER